MIARDNDTRAQLNDAARELWRALGLLGEQRSYGGIMIALGERVICRRNDQLLDLDNGTRGTVRHLDEDRIVIETDSRLVRALPAAYVAEHVEHAYALTGHGMQGATVERAIVLASPRDLSAGWCYTALSRARGTTRLLIHDERVAVGRSEVAPAERVGAATDDALLAQVERRMHERDSQQLAIEQLAPAGRSDDLALENTRQLAYELPQEQGAARLELHDHTRNEALDAMREELNRLRAQRSALPVRTLTQLHDAELRIAELERGRQRVARDLAGVAGAPKWRLGRWRDPQELERARLSAALAAHDRALEEARERRAGIEQELGHPEQVRSEREGLDRAIERLGELMRERELEGPDPPGPRRLERELERNGGHDLGPGF